VRRIWLEKESTWSLAKDLLRPQRLAWRYRLAHRCRRICCFVAFHLAFAATLFLIFAGMLLGSLNAMTNMLGLLSASLIPCG